MTVTDGIVKDVALAIAETYHGRPVSNEYLLSDATGGQIFLRCARAALTAANSRAQVIRAEAQFLIDRLDEFAPDIDTANNERDFYGHVEPSIARLRALLQQEGE